MTFAPFLTTKDTVARLQGFSDGSVLFAEGGKAAEDNNNFFWDDTNDILSIGPHSSGLDLTLDGNAIARHLTVQVSGSIFDIEASFFRYSNSAGVAPLFALLKARGTEDSPATIVAGDTLGTILAAGYDGTDYNQVADILLKSADAVDTGLMDFRTRDTADGSPAVRLRIEQDGLVNVGAVSPASYSLADGDNDLGVTSDFEVLGQSRFEDEIGWRTAPETSSAFVAEYTDSSIVSFFRIRKTTTYGGSPPASGVNVLNFSLTDQSSVNATFRAVRHSSEYDRGTHPTTNTQTCVEIVGYGQKTSRTIDSASSTFNWTGFKVSPFSPVASRIVDGTFNLRDILTTGINWDNYENINKVLSTTLDYLSADLGGSVKIEEERIYATETDNGFSTETLDDGKAASIQLDPSYARSTNTEAASFDVDRHNYILLDNVSSSNMGSLGGVNDACVFWFDAAAGTHKAVDGSTTKQSPGAVDAWIKHNINGTIYFVPAYLSKTS